MTDLNGYIDEDRFFGPSYVDLDEWREKPTRYRYIHGGFEGTDTRFSLYIPPTEQYEGRMLQFLQGGTGGDEASTIGPDHFVSSIEIAFDRGAFLVESNQGHIGNDMSGLKGENSVGIWRASAATARFAKFAAERLFGAAPHHSYIYGGSGGGMRSIQCVEQTSGIWDGAAPFVIPHEMSGTSFLSLEANVVRVLGRDGIARLEDATEVGGAGTPFEGLSTEQAQVLADLYRAGWPRRSSLRGLQELAMVWPWTAWSIEQSDPAFFDLFWNARGFAGHDQPEILARDRVRFTTKVVRVLTAGEVARLPETEGVADEWGLGPDIRSWARRYPEDMPVAAEFEDLGSSPGKTFGATIRVADGPAASRVVYAMGSYGSIVLAGAIGGRLFHDVRPGDTLDIDNDRFIAYCHYYRHRVEPKFAEFGAMVCDGQPIHPQRPMIARGTSAPYAFNPRCSKMIITQNMLDRGAWPSCALSYREHLSPEFGQDNLRIYFIDNAQHFAGTMIASGSNHIPAPTTTQIDYDGCVESAVRSLIDWVEHDIAPPEQTRYTLGRDRDVSLPLRASERLGIQPVVEVTANGHAGRIEVARGAAVRFEAAVEMPPHCGSIVGIEWDFDGAGAFPLTGAVEPGYTTGTLCAEHSYQMPGTYFACARVTAQRDGDADAKLYRVVNLGRIRVIVV